MATQYTAKALLEYGQRGDPNWDVPIINTFGKLDAVAAVGALCVALHETPSTSLNVQVAPGSFLTSAGVVVAYAGTASQAVTTATTTYLWLDEAGTLTTGAAWPVSPYVVRLAAVAAGATTITSITDARIAYAVRPPVAATQAVTTTYAVLDTDRTVFADTSGGGYTVTLPTPVGRAGREFEVIRTTSDTNSLVVATAAGLINGASTATISTTYGYRRVRSNGTNWSIIGSG